MAVQNMRECLVRKLILADGKKGAGTSPYEYSDGIAAGPKQETNKSRFLRLLLAAIE